MEARTATRPLARPVFLALGVGFVGLGYLGAFLPLMPSTVFFLLALWAFKRSSPRFEDWLLNRSLAAPILRDWDNGRQMTRRTKVVAILLLWASILLSCELIVLRQREPWLLVLLPAIAVGVSVFIATRPEPPSEA